MRFTEGGTVEGTEVVILVWVQSAPVVSESFIIIAYQRCVLQRHSSAVGSTSKPSSFFRIDWARLQSSCPVESCDCCESVFCVLVLYINSEQPYKIIARTAELITKCSHYRMHVRPLTIIVQSPANKRCFQKKKAKPSCVVSIDKAFSSCRRIMGC